jgi:hypothetical protein
MIRHRLGQDESHVIVVDFFNIVVVAVDLYNSIRDWGSPFLPIRQGGRGARGKIAAFREWEGLIRDRSGAAIRT